MTLPIPRAAFKETGLNPHFFHKMKQAERNMLNTFDRRGKHRTGRKWARQFQKWADKLITAKP